MIEKHKLLGKNKDFSTPKRAPRSTIGVDHSGKPKAGFYAKPGAPASSVHHGPDTVALAKAHASHIDLVTRGGTFKGNVNPRAGAPKRHDPTPVHAGMTPAQEATHGVGGIGHATSTAAIAGAARLESNPLAKPPQGKTFSPPAFATGHRTRTNGGMSRDAMHDMGNRILAEAHKVAGPDHPNNLGKRK